MNRGAELTTPSESIAKKRLTKLAVGLGAVVAAATLVGKFSPNAESITGPAVTIQNQALTDHGKPMFLEGIYRACSPDIGQAWHDLGPSLNLDIEGSCGESDFKLLAKKAAGHKMKVIGTYGNGDNLKNTPNLIGYNEGDEPDHATLDGVCPSPFNPSRAEKEANNPDNLPFFVNFTKGFASDQAPPSCGTKSSYPSLMKSSNAVSFDEYYWNFYQCHNLVAPNSQFRDTQDLIKISGNRLVGAFVDVNTINWASCPDPVNRTRVRNQILQSVVAGAKAIYLFQPNFPDQNHFNTYSLSSDIAAGIRNVFDNSITPMQDVLLSGKKLDWPVDLSGPLVYGAWQYKGRDYFWVVNTTEAVESVNLNLPTNLPQVGVVGEQRQIRTGATLTDSEPLGPLEDRLYVGRVASNQPQSTNQALLQHA